CGSGPFERQGLSSPRPGLSKHRLKTVSNSSFVPTAVKFHLKSNSETPGEARVKPSNGEAQEPIDSSYVHLSAQSYTIFFPKADEMSWTASLAVRLTH
ncbi:MAG TPA: hypothetical protein VFL96_01720, partial [Acidobacteriaceae bacterium]|nr:hypothetical protein [Acidobacteriaceae bacterium]